MKASKIIIKNLFGITEKQLDGSSVELIGGNGTGKTLSSTPSGMR